MAALRKTEKLLYEALLKKGSISKDVLESLLKEAESTDQGLAEMVMGLGLLSERDILGILARELKVSYVDLKDISIDKTIIEKIPVKIASYYKFVPLKLEHNTLTVAVSYPLDIKTQDEIRMQLGYDIEMTLACKDDVHDGLKKYYGLGADTMHQISSQQTASEDAEIRPENERVEDIEKLAEDASVIKLVNQIILEGWKKRATDIHIEPYRGGVDIRYRVDGILYDANVSAEMNSFLNAIISRIKIMSNLNIVERRLPQDGRAIVKVQNQMLDLRISTMPTPFGESVVIRILPAQMLFSLEKLGLSKHDRQIFENLIQKPHGIIFLTGPTGSGKTTTLYACLSKINTKDRKIITLEDPIEYEIRGVTQIQVMPQIDFDFARGLRSVLRHDPDVIMVGEVRDLETAEIAVRVSLTGHLVFSTLHTTDAVSGITRLVDIGVEPFLVTSSVEAFIAQRLIRVLCKDCKYEDKAAPQPLKDMIAKDLDLKDAAKVKIYKSKGCKSCNSTGFFGRTAIYEIFLVDEEIKELVLERASHSKLRRVAISKGMRTLRQDGWQKVISGETTPEEVVRVTSAQEELGAKGAPGAKTGSEYGESGHSTEEESDKRAYKRLASKVNIRYKVYKSEKELIKRGAAREHLSVCTNISAGGLLLLSDENLQVGALMDLRIELPVGEKPIEVLAKVTRSDRREDKKSYDVAACFLDITSAERARLERFVTTETEG